MKSKVTYELNGDTYTLKIDHNVQDRTAVLHHSYTDVTLDMDGVAELIEVLMDIINADVKERPIDDDDHVLLTDSVGGPLRQDIGLANG